ncbi:MAG: MFS transporter [Deltaproteobacteria bacterium]|nr:MAG: MFS transporter [Deltaproteobacteria bacterium]
MTEENHQSLLFNPVLIAGSLILIVGFAIRASFGVFQIPIEEEFGWLRADFSLAIAIQNLAWGIGQPLFSMIAEKYGDRKAIFLGSVLYAVGLILSSYAVTPLAHQFLEILIGFGIAGMGFGVILAVIGRTTSEKNRSLALGIATSAGSLGQIIGPPVIEKLLQQMPWQEVFMVLAVIVMASMVLLPMIKSKPPTAMQGNDLSMSEVLGKALKDPSFAMIFLGFFSCGFQIAFITAHFPAYIAEMCSAIPQNSVLRSMGIASTSSLGAFSIAIIGTANLVGTITAGALGSRFSKKSLLSLIYLGRTIAAALFIMIPMTPDSVVIFSIVMGSLWLATVPLTSGLVGHIYGMKFMGTLYGIVFFSHQLGGFLGVWLGGLFYDQFGNYDLVWWVGIGVGAFSAIIHLPVREKPMVMNVSSQLKTA